MTDKQDEQGLGKNAVHEADGNTPRPGGSIFQIHVRGHLNREWSDWLDGLEVELLDNGEMVLSGRVTDQAALMGILNKLHRLNLTLLSVCEVRKKHKE